MTASNRCFGLSRRSRPLPEVSDHELPSTFLVALKSEGASMSEPIDKHVVVVGGGQRDGLTIGNGRATSVLFGRSGAEVFVVDRELDRAIATLNQIEIEGGRGHAFAADVSAPGGPDRITAAAVERMGEIDVLVNNVGISDGDGDGLTTDEAAWDAIMSTNLKSTWLMCRACIPLMRTRLEGVIVNISSAAALNIGSKLAYGISKNGVNMLTLRLARENAHFGVRINSVMPGPIDTPMGVDSKLRPGGDTRDQLAASRARNVPMGRQGTGWDIAHAVSFLASDEAAFITGALLPVDGGMSTVVGGGYPAEIGGQSSVG